MSIKFYNVKKRASVEVEESTCCKVVYRRETSTGVQERYGIKSKDDDGTNLTKFCSKADFDVLDCPIV